MSRTARRADRQTLHVVNRVQEALLSKRLQNQPLVVAVSGGADSMALLAALALLQLSLIHI